MRHLLDLSEIAMISDCSSDYLVQLASAALNLKSLVCGSGVNFNFEALQKIQSRNSLAKMEELRANKSTDITVECIFALVTDCPRLIKIGGIEYWEKITEQV